MESGVIAGIVTSFISVIGLYLVAKVNTNGSNKSSTVESALALQKRYAEMNEGLVLDVEKLRIDMIDLNDKIKDMEKKFQEKETYYVIELEKKDEIIENLEIVIVEKDMVIDELKGGA